MKSKCFIAVLWFASMLIQAQALTVNEAVTEVLNTHPTILEKMKQFNATVHDYDRSMGAYRPKLDVQGEIGWQDASNSSTGYKNRDSDVSAVRLIGQQILFDGKRALFDSSARAAFARFSLFDYCETANNVAMDTVESYVTLLKAFELVRLAEENVSIHQQILKSIRSRVESGSSGKSELERVQGRLAAAQATMIVRQNDYRRSMFNLHKLLGRMIEAPELEKPVLPVEAMPAALNMALTKMRENHPALVAADYVIEQRNLEHRRDQSDFKPDVTLEASRNLRGNYGGIDGYDKESNVAVKVNFRLFDGGERRSTTEKARSMVHKEQQARKRVVRSLINGMQLSWTGYKLLESQLGAIRKSIIFTRQALNSYKEEFKLGKRLMINILDAEGELQNARALFAGVKYDMLLSKYRILFSLGTLPEDLGIEVPFKEELDKAKKLRPAMKDELPLLNDHDGDGIEDTVDISQNSLASTTVSEYGETDYITREYLSEPVCKASAVDPSVIKGRDDLQQRAIQKDVPNRIDFVSFQPRTEALSDESKILMRELIQQLKTLSGEGLVRIEVVTGELPTKDANYDLALQRSYSLKKILMSHNIDSELIVVDGAASNETASGTHSNYINITVVTDPLMMNETHETANLSEVKFASGTVELGDAAKEELKRLVMRLKTREKKQFDLIVFSNDSSDAAKNHEISRQRCKLIKELMVAEGLPESSVTEIAWGSYEAYADLYNFDAAAPPNRVEVLIRD